jgi:GntR family transcriptional regulator
MDARAPLHLRIESALRAALETGAYPPDRPLPGEHQLAAQFQAARMTVRRALASLERAGLIRRERGRGTWPASRGAGPLTDGLHANMRRFVAESRVRLLQAAMRPATDDAARALSVREGTACLYLARVRVDARGPFAHVVTWVPPGLLDAEEAAGLGAGAVMDALAERGHVMAGAKQLILGIAADAGVAAALDIPAGSALTRLDRVAHDSRRRPIEFSRWLYRPDRFTYSVTLGAEAADFPPRWVPTLV